MICLEVYMSRIIDLTREIVDNIPVYPGDDAVNLQQTRHIEEDKYNNHRLNIGMHAGTHVDGPMHMLNCTRYISNFPLDQFVGKGIVIDEKGKELIDYSEGLENNIEEGSIVLINTGYAEYFGTKAYFSEHPAVTEAFGRMLVDKKVKALCVDTPSPDKYPYEVHKLLFENGIYIVENVMNLDALKGLDNYEVFIIPLKIKADSSPARVFARMTL